MKVQETAPWWFEMFRDLDEDCPYVGDYWTVPTKLGQRPALVVVDAIRSFVGREGQTLADATAEYPTACGPVAWASVAAIRKVLDLARAAGWPVVYTTGLPGGAPFGGTIKGEMLTPTTSMDLPGAVEIPAEIAPRPEEVVIAKPKASAFFDTPLVSYLVRERVDTVVVVGGATSGCVRATVVDSYSQGFATLLVEEGCFDRSRLSHGVNLTEMHLKYADVVTLSALRALTEAADDTELAPASTG